MIPPRMESGTPVKKFTPMSCMACTNASLSIMLDEFLRGGKNPAHYKPCYDAFSRKRTGCAGLDSVIPLPNATRLRFAHSVAALGSCPRRRRVDDERSEGVSQHRVGGGVKHADGSGADPPRSQHHRIPVQERAAFVR